MSNAESSLIAKIVPESKGDVFSFEMFTSHEIQMIRGVLFPDAPVSGQSIQKKQK